MSNFCVPIPVPADVKLFGVIFFDYNGDGSRQANEPGIIGARVSVGSESTSAQCNGVYYFRNLPDGSYNISVRAASFRYISLSTSDFRPIETTIEVTVSGSTRRDIGLMQGFLTLPFRPGTDFEVWSYFDLDPGPGIRRYDGRTDPEAHVANNHSAIDYRVNTGTSVVAAAPGEVVFVGTDPNDSCPGNITVRVFHTVGDQLFETAYNHLSSYEVGVGNWVSRGQLIAYSGESGECSIGRPHLELDFEFVPWGGIGRHLDPYRDVTNPESLNYWTKDNDPQYPPQ